MDLTCALAWEVFKLVAKRVIETFINEDRNDISTVKNCTLDQIKTILHWVAIFNLEAIAKVSLRSCLKNNILKAVS